MSDFFTDFADTAGDLAAGVKAAAEDTRRAVAYTDTQITGGIKAGYAAPLDSQLSWPARTWLYASDTEKVFIVLGVAGLAFAVWSYYKG